MDEIEGRIAEIEGRADAATPGPWAITFGAAMDEPQRFTAGNNAANKVFIAHARADIPWLIEQLRAVRVDGARKAEALEPFAHFARQWARKPLRGIDDAVYAIHSGEDRAELRLSDCQRAASLVDANRSAPPTGQTT